MKIYNPQFYFIRCFTQKVQLSFIITISKPQKISTKLLSNIMVVHCKHTTADQFQDIGNVEYFHFI